MPGSPLVMEVEGLEELQEILQKFPREWQMNANRVMMPALAILEKEVKVTARSDTGVAAASVGSSVERALGSEIIGKVGSNKEYAPYALEYGRGPGGMPPPSLLEEWAGRHGMAGAGFVIARAIAVRGVSAPKTMSKAIQTKGGAVVKEIEKGITELLRRLGL